MTRWPAAPPPGTPCDASRGVDYSGHSPSIRKCGQPATETARDRVLGFETYLCTECAVSLEGRGVVERNPRFLEREKKDHEGEEFR